MVHENVRRIRKAKGISMKHVARVLGLSEMGYSHLETGSVRLDVERLRTISSVLGVSESVFFDDKLTESVVTDIANSHSTA